MGDRPRWTVEVDRDACIGSGMCLVYAPATFEHDEEATAVLQDGALDDLETVKLAVEACPTRALHLTIDGEEMTP